MILDSFAAYVKQLWKNKPDTSTPVSAERLGHIEDGIKGNSDAIEAIAAAVLDSIINDPNKIASMAAVYALQQNLQDQITTLNSNLTYTYNEVVHEGITWYVHTLRIKDIQIISAQGTFSCEGCNNAWGGVYASGTIRADFTYPAPFAELPSIQLNVVPSGTNTWPMMTADVTKYKGPGVQLIRGTTYGAFSGRLNILAIGRAG